MYLFELLALVAVLRPPRRLAAWLLLCISAVGVTLLALVVPNVGALYRFRYTFWVLLIVLGTKGFEALLKSSGRMRPSLGGVLSLFDGSSIKRVAAMACGCPLVVSDIAAHREILDDRTACFVSPDEPGQVADAIKTTLQSRAEAQTRAQAGRAKAGHWGIEDMGLLYEKLYLNLLATRDTPTSHDYLYYSP